MPARTSGSRQPAAGSRQGICYRLPVRVNYRPEELHDGLFAPCWRRSRRGGQGDQAKHLVRVLAGAGLVAFIDETVFRQLLHWHYFYDRPTLAVGLMSDGLFHAGGFIAMVAGLFLLADAHRRGGFVPKRWWGGLLLGPADSSSTTGSCSTSCSDCMEPARRRRAHGQPPHRR